ncbi:phosphatidylcholine:ceramide cholinephosphotransferase 2-like isoform X2 [Daktulosphaira vitifoliae]|nr:phosphatidylcholine:ceramide cholinephosphotransferase 2-like isoform X2 [Daktulosphaira vitifoliae]
MVLEQKENHNTDGIRNKSISYICNDRLNDKVYFNTGMPPANGNLNEQCQRQPLLGLCKEGASCVKNNGADWKSINGSSGVHSDSLDNHQRSKTCCTHNDIVEDKQRPDSGIMATEDDEQFSQTYPNSNAHGTPVYIDMSPSCINISPIKNKIKYPQEKFKTFIAFILLLINLLINTTSLAMVHERVPDRTYYKPLPDTFLDIIPASDWALDVSEILIMISTNLSFIVIACHKYRFIVVRRLLFMLSLLYLLRSVTMFVTVLPVASTTYYCSPKTNETSPMLIAKRVFQLISGFGLSINGKHTFCGDYMYSGHTTILVMSYLMISEYSPKKWFILHWSSWLMAVIGVVMVLIAHGHYTIDVIIAYFFTTRLFWMYHTLANNNIFKQSSTYNYLSRAWWFRIFCYFEENIDGPLPRQYDWPLPWPKCFAISNYQNQNS